MYNKRRGRTLSPHYVLQFDTEFVAKVIEDRGPMLIYFSCEPEASPIWVSAM